MYLAPLAAPLDALLAGLPFTVAEELDAGAVHQQMQRSAGTAIGDSHLEGLLSAAQRRIVWNRPVQPARCRRRATIPAVCLSGSLNRTLIDRQNWIAELEKTGGRPGRPSCCACQVISLSSQISSDPRFLSASL